jgi:hypothetical protein
MVLHRGYAMLARDVIFARLGPIFSPIHFNKLLRSARTHYMLLSYSVTGNILLAYRAFLHGGNI